MDEGLKQRLVGAAVLVLLAVIFVPMLLESDPEPDEVGFDLGTPPSPESEFSSRIIPLKEPSEEAPAPVVPPASESVPAGEEVAERAARQGAEVPETLPAGGGLQVEALEPEPLAAVVLEPDAPAGTDLPEALGEDGGTVAAETEEQTPPAAWAAQFGSFAERRNALVLRNRLRAKGYPAFTESIAGEQGVVTRVLVGPEPTRARTVATIEALRRDTGLDGFVVRHPRD